jgi:hypothetical protein
MDVCMSYLFYLSSIANFGLNLFFSITCLTKSAVTIADPPMITLAIPIMAVPLKAPATVTPAVPITKVHGILFFIFIERFIRP